ncbi:MAG: ferredoxin--NADP reductase [Phaeodactylibacter sp.]|uniref:ferredoxin--NADP reductase n=1 Tax=Phaeodactylibacter sp. TaxID=1940289 RepID=UPI0032EFED7F
MMDQELLTLQVARIDRPVMDSAHIIFEIKGQPVPDYQAGQFLTLLFPELGPGPVRRSYSLASAPGVDAQLSICVKRTVNGQASAYLTKRLQVGDVLQALPPAGQFVLPEGPKPLLLIAGGSGFVPMFSLLKAALNSAAPTSIQLLLANRNARSVLFREELKQLESAHPDRLRVLHLLSQPTEDCEAALAATAHTDIKQGRLSNAWLEFWAAQALGPALADAHAYICGPPGLMLKAAMTLRFLGFGAGRLHQEDFIIHSPFRPKADQLPLATVELRYKGQTLSFPVKPGQTLLEGALLAGIELPYSCRSGSCTTCSAQLTAGRVEMYTHNSRVDSEATNGHIFTCVAYPVTPQVQLTVR